MNNRCDDTFYIIDDYSAVDSITSNYLYTFDKVIILTDTNTQTHCYNKKLINSLGFCNAYNINIEVGEKHKSLQSCSKIWEQLLYVGASRQSLLVNVGGGTITDIGGFSASLFQRGMSFVNIPTTLLSMTDAAHGGKTGVNLNGIKNCIGTFSKPLHTIIVIDFLKTLPEKELKSGYAEILKHALIFNSHFWQELKNCNNINNLNLHDWLHIIKQSVEIKSKIIKNDYRDNNERQILNFGHTVGHALEAFSIINDNNPLSHGHAVAIGMICESFIANKMYLLHNKAFNEITQTISYIYDYYNISHDKIDEIVNLVNFDKKKNNGTIHISIATEIGRAKHNIMCTPSLIKESLVHYIINFK